MPDYEWADRAHCPRNDGEMYPTCGSASASPNPLDEQPITRTEAEFRGLPEGVTCWECRSIIS